MNPKLTPEQQNIAIRAVKTARDRGWTRQMICAACGRKHTSWLTDVLERRFGIAPDIFLKLVQLSYEEPPYKSRYRIRHSMKRR